MTVTRGPEYSLKNLGIYRQQKIGMNATIMRRVSSTVVERLIYVIGWKPTQASHFLYR
ncbi:hypothetical protein O9992_08735 [Vibrio lentus]|nr:hypothetical protein [Vibrio lentus]